MSDNKLKRAVIALGFFDGVHLGHLQVIRKARDIAKENNAITVAFTFDGNLKGYFKANEKNILSFTERTSALINGGADEVLVAPLTKEFLSYSPSEFLRYLNERYNIIAYVSGEDYRFGKMGGGDINYLKQYAEENGQTAYAIEGVILNGERVSSTAVKKWLTKGEIKKANGLLGKKYAVSGTVFEDRKIGKKLGYPTVNIKIDRDKAKLKDGVYAGEIILGGKKYRTIINYGARPTFDLEEKLIEAHVIDFNGDLYGKEITLYFCGYIRDIVKFNSAEELTSQLAKDVENTKGGAYD